MLSHLVDFLLLHSGDHSMEGHGDSPETVAELHHAVGVFCTGGCLALHKTIFMLVEWVQNLIFKIQKPYLPCNPFGR